MKTCLSQDEGGVQKITTWTTGFLDHLGSPLSLSTQRANARCNLLKKTPFLVVLLDIWSGDVSFSHWVSILVPILHHVMFSPWKGCIAKISPANITAQQQVPEPFQAARDAVVGVKTDTRPDTSTCREITSLQNAWRRRCCSNYLEMVLKECLTCGIVSTNLAWWNH